jgi:putative Mn2+ efflux pump MntP
MHIPPDSIAPVWGFITAAASGLGLYLAQVAGDAIPTAIRAWLEGGFSIAFVIALIYGIVTLWRRLAERDTHIADLNREIRTDWKSQNEKLILVLERLERDK